MPRAEPQTRVFFSGLSFPEGPVLLDDGSWLVVELGRARGCLTRVDRLGRSMEVVAKTGRPNGLALDRQGAVWIAESLNASVMKLEPGRAPETWATSCAGEPLLWPNNLCLGPDGALYLTDSGARVDDFLDGDVPRPGFQSVPLDGKVCRFDLATGAGTVLDRGLQFTNGIAFGPDGWLYVNETMSGNVYRYDLGRPRPSRELFGNVLAPDWPSNDMRGPDGMAFDATGLLYVTVFGQGDVTVLDRKGAIAGRIPLRGRAPTNVAFGPPGSREIYVVEDELGQIEVADVPADGLRLFR